MRVLSLAALLVAAALVPIAGAVAAHDRDAAASEQRRQLNSDADAHTAALSTYFQRATTVSRLVSHLPTFTDLEHGGDRHRSERVLRYLERLYPHAVGEACVINRQGHELARMVGPRPARASELSKNERFNFFFAESFALPRGHVLESHPYISGDTRQWVIAIASLVPDRHLIVHFELTVEGVRHALLDAPGSRRHGLVVVDARTGAVVIDATRPQRLGQSLGFPGDRRFVRLVHGATMVGGRLAAVRRLHGGPNFDNDWLIVATAPEAPPTLLGSSGAMPPLLLLVALVLIAGGLLGLRYSTGELRRIAETDSLTGLANRRRLFIDLERHVARGSRIALVLLDLNGFKAYNDSFGHAAGDSLLIRLARALDEAVRADGRAYRLGGDEFCVLAEPSDDLEARVLAALSASGDGFLIDAAAGLVDLRSEASSASAALSLADERMYRGKSASRSADGQATAALLCALAERHPGLDDHVSSVAALAERVAATLGLDPAACHVVRRAAELHDIGKVAIPSAILAKPGPLDDDEWDYMRRHTLIGERIVRAAPALAPVAPLVRASHERWNGSGYPDGLRGEEIPLGARIVAVCDAFEAMTADRPYSRARSDGDALVELRRCAGTQFDPAVVEAFDAAFELPLRLAA
jgi:diguanylate cyclase (GGDEF)-like protein